jgi:hypothetical protein
MIDYKTIEDSALIGTMKFCIKHLPEDFENVDEALLSAFVMARNFNDFSIIDLLNQNNFVHKEELYSYILSDKTVRRYYLRQKDFFKPMHVQDLRFEETIQNFNIAVKEDNPYYVKLFIKNILKHRIVINDKSFKKLNVVKLPTSIRKYLLKQLTYDDIPESTNRILCAFKHKHNNLDMFIRICKPKIDWNTLIYKISPQLFYQISSIINTMRIYPSVKCSFTDMKYKHPLKSNANTFSNTIQDYLKDYMTNSIVFSVMGDSNNNITRSEYRIPHY